MNNSFLEKGCRILLPAILFFFLAATLKAQEKVLFVGNSYTYFWNLPQTVEAMSKSIESDMISRQSTAGGVSLQDHWEGNRDLKTKDLITKTWDKVILQNHSLSTMNNTEAFHEYGQKWIDDIQNTGAEPILYITWAREFNPLMQETISKEYLKLAKKYQILTIPIGPIWAEALKLRPDLKLYDADQSHPSPLGTYLTGLVFTKVLTGKSIVDIPARITDTDKNGEKLYLHIVPPNDASFLKELVDSFDYGPYQKGSN